MCVGDYQGRFPRGCDGCCCRKDLCSVTGKAGFLRNQWPENSTTSHCRARARSPKCPSISFRGDLIFNLSVNSTSKIKVPELREPKTAKLLGRIELPWQQLLPGDSSAGWRGEGKGEDALWQQPYNTAMRKISPESVTPSFSHKPQVPLGRRFG